MRRARTNLVHTLSEEDRMAHASLVAVSPGGQYVLNQAFKDQISKAEQRIADNPSLRQGGGGRHPL